MLSVKLVETRITYHVMGNPLHSLGVLLDLFDVEVCKRHLASVSFTRRLYCPEGHRVFLCSIDDGQQGNLTAVLLTACAHPDQ